MKQALHSLSSHLARRLYPLVLLASTLVSLSAPSAFFWLRLRALQKESQQTAQQIASFLRQEASQHPRLWRYDAIKLFRHLRFASPQKHLLSVLALDQQNRILLQHQKQAPALHRKRALWASVPFTGHAQQSLGIIWIALSTEEIRQQTLALWLFFSLLGIALAFLLFRLPLQAVFHAEEALQKTFSDLQQTQKELTQINLHLESTVQSRTQELEQAYSQLQEKERTQRKLSQRSLSIQENERRAISRDLHDAAGQSLTAIRINLQLLSTIPNPPPTLLEQTTTLVDQTLEEIRRAVRQLTPTILEDRGLLAALRSLCADLQERTQLIAHLDISPDIPALPAEIELVCYRITQETLTNIVRHAQATRFWLLLHCVQDQQVASIHLQIVDDGCGLSSASAPFSQGSGLQGIRERVEMLDGSFQLQSPPKLTAIPATKGTQLTIQLPLPHNKSI